MITSVATIAATLRYVTVDLPNVNTTTSTKVAVQIKVVAVIGSTVLLMSATAGFFNSGLLRA
jgi:hypothetical protein